MRNSLLIKIMGAFLILVLISALVISISTSIGTRRAFNLYSNSNRERYSERLAASLASYYESTNSWQGVDQVLQSGFSQSGRMMMGGGNMMGKGRNSDLPGFMGGMMDDSNERLILADAGEKIIFDSWKKLEGEDLSHSFKDEGLPILVNDSQVGWLVVTSDTIKSGTPAGAFLESVNHSIFFSVLAGVFIAILLGALLFNQITSPLRQLRKAVMEVGSGNFNQRVNINSQDEIAELGNSFNQMAENLKKAQEDRQHYMADIAHELRTPLTAIQGTVEALQDNILPLNSEQLEILHEQTTLLNRLVDDLRLLSLAEAGQLKLDKKLCDPITLLKRIVDAMKPLADQKMIDLELMADENLPQVFLDKDRFAQIINNLLSNAIRYTPESGSIRVKVGISLDSKSLSIEVIDTGSGISPEDLPHVFDRFYRADKSRARVSGGAGLGLAIVYQLVEAHNGKINVISPVNKEGEFGGTQFSITFPLSSG